MKRFLYSICVIGLLLLAACDKDELSNPLDSQLKKSIQRIAPNGKLEHFILPHSKDYANIPQEPKNPLSDIKVELGKMLFFETGLALAPVYDFCKETYSCGTCHVPSAGMTPSREQGIADGGIGFGENGERRTRMASYDEDEMDVQGARPLALINAAFVKNTSWSGAFGGNDNNIGTEDVWGIDPVTAINHEGYLGLESQNIEGLELHRMVVDKEVTDRLGYTPYFDKAFPEFHGDERYSATTASFAISAYLRSITTTEAPFQSWLKGDYEAMTDEEKKGAMLFFGKARCYNCHSGKSLNNPDRFFGIGVKDLYETGTAFNTGPNDKRNFGRGFFTQKPEDLYKFKVPQLYNMRDAKFYFHGSSKHSLKEVVEYFNNGIPENANVPAEQIDDNFFRPLGLTEEEVNQLTLFLEKSLHDQDIERYMPERVLSNNCMPNNDPFSQIDMGCK